MQANFLPPFARPVRAHYFVGTARRCTLCGRPKADSVHLIHQRTVQVPRGSQAKL